MSFSFDDGYGGSEAEEIDTGVAIMGAVGYEIMSGRKFAIDLQLRLGTGSYEKFNDQIHAGSLSVGFNWY